MLLAVLCTAGGALAGCSPSGGTAPAPTTTVTTPSPQPTATAGAGTTMDDAHSAKALFDRTNEAVIAAHSKPGGRDFVDALTAAGFDKAAMQVTPDRTSLGYKVGSVQFSVLIGGECLIGQYGAGGVGYHSLIAPALSTGGCLVGRTRAIDW